MADIKAVGGLSPVLYHNGPSIHNVEKQTIRSAEDCLHFFQRLSGEVVVKSIMTCCQSSCAHDHVCYITPLCILPLCLVKILVLY